jgi:hypothetical protein
MSVKIPAASTVARIAMKINVRKFHMGLAFSQSQALITGHP